MTDLVDFLRNRYDEEEQKAQAAGESRIAWLTYLDDQGQMHYTTVAAGSATAGAVDDVWVADGKELPAPSRVLVVYDPARVLRKVEAQRRIIELHPITTDVIDDPAIYVKTERQPFGCRTDHEFYDGETAGFGYCETLRLLALPYADHPDYDERWRP